MKKIKNILSLLFLGLAVSMTMVSCLDDNDDNSSKGLTDEQKQNYALLMSGDYTGKLYYFDKNIDKSNDKNQTDSIVGYNVRYNFPDMSIEMNDFPARLLFKQLSGYDELKEAAKDKTVDIKLGYEPYDAKNSVVSFYMKEIKPVSVSLTYGGETHDFKVYFLVNTIGAWKDKLTQFTVIEYGIAESTDEKGNPVWLTGSPVYPESQSVDDYTTKFKDVQFVFSNIIK